MAKECREEGEKKNGGQAGIYRLGRALGFDCGDLAPKSWVSSKVEVLLATRMCSPAVEPFPEN